MCNSLVVLTKDTLFTSVPIAFGKVIFCKNYTSTKIPRNSNILQEKFPCLYSFVIDEDISISNYFSTDNTADLFHLPLSSQAYQQWQELQIITDSTPVTIEKDVWKYKWGDKYTAKKFYTLCFQHIDPPAPLLWIWKSKLWPKLKKSYGS